MSNCIFLSFILLFAPPIASPASGATKIILVIGAEGTPEYGRQFHQWAAAWEQAGQRAGAELVIVGRQDAGDLSDRDRLERLLAAEPNNAADELWLVLIGHGTFDERTARFNLRGPDVSADAVGLQLTIDN